MTKPHDRAGYQPVPYHQDPDETVTCPNCGRMDDPDANFCDQCGHPLTASEDYARKDDEDVQCPSCSLFNDDDAEFCDQCGIRLEGRPDVVVDDEDASGEGTTFGSNAARAPRDNLIRARVGGGVELRETTDGSAPSELFGTFSQFNSWYPIESMWEGRFLERVLPGAFLDTIANDRANMRVLFDHGMDPSLGSKPLGPIRTLEERDDGPYYEVPLLDTDYNRNFVIPALTGKLMNGQTAGSQLGASFRFSVPQGGDRWVMTPKPTKRNPEAIPERSIIRTKTYEFGPVTFPANSGADAAGRSLSDDWMGRLAGDDWFFAEFSERVGRRVADRVLGGVSEELRAQLRLHATRPVRTERQEQLRRRARALLALTG